MLSGGHTIVGVATSITAFVGRTLRGPVDLAVGIQSFSDFELVFGGLWALSTMSYAVQQFFLNGGTDAIVVRVAHDAVTARLDLPANSGAEFLQLNAASPGQWGSSLLAHVDYDTRTPVPPESLFSLFVKDSGANVTEEFRDLSLDRNHPSFITRVLEQQSQLVTVSGLLPSTQPDPQPLPDGETDPFAGTAPANFTAAVLPGDDGAPIQPQDVTGDAAGKTGIFALDGASLFNLLCLTPLERDVDMPETVYFDALAYCRDRRAMLILDPPSAWTTVMAALSGVDQDFSTLSRDRNAVLYFPRVRVPDPLQENGLETFAPCGAVAGVIARTDANRGVWRAPAGQDAGVVGIHELAVSVTDAGNGQLEAVAVNCLRTFPVAGTVVWGARTLRGADFLADEWKYLPVRRTALFIEESLYRGTQWVVFEPNDERLWAQLRLTIGAFLQDLFRQGAFQGSSPRDAYFVKCDNETTTQNDIDLGQVNILVGFAPLKPAEFVIIQIQQLAGNMKT